MSAIFSLLSILLIFKLYFCDIFTYFCAKFYIMTYLEIAEEVLNQVGKPLKPQEIWDYALSLGFDLLKDTTGKTPENTIAAQLYTNIKDNADTTVFVQTDRGTFGLKNFTIEREIEQEDAENETYDPYKIALRFQKVTNFAQLKIFLNLLKELTKFAGLSSSDPRLVCTSTRSKRFNVNINFRYVLALNYNDNAIALIIRNEDVTNAQQLKGYAGIVGSFANQSSFIAVNFTQTETDYAQWIELWKKSVMVELSTAIASPFRRANDVSLYRAATDEKFRKEVLGIIETDEDTHDIQSAEEENEPKAVIYDPLKTSLDIQEDKFSIFEYMRKYDRKQLVIDPDYQRNIVWKTAQMSRFIESILLNFPLPPLYLNQRTDGNFVIIDGLQRTTALHLFVKNQFALKDLKTLDYLNDKKFSELPEAFQTRIEDKNLNIYILKPSTPLEVVYELFDRINTGGTPLNRQEVRNCIFIGKATELLKELATAPEFINAIAYGIDSVRMKDQEAILRYLAFHVFDYEQTYQGDLSPFVENAMRTINQMKSDEIHSLRTDFIRVMKWAYQIFGEKTFRIPVYHENGELKLKGFINISILESVGNFISKYSDEFLQKNQTQIAQNYNLLIQNKDYLNAVKTSTGNKAQVLKRFKLAEQILSNI